MLIINTGGTFNKRYDPIRGELYVPADNIAIESVVNTFALPVKIEGVIYKDSLEMNDEDRALLACKIEATDDKHIVVVHGTDTMDQSAQFLANMKLDKVIVFTGAMVPLAIDPIEATTNLSMAVGYANNAVEGVYIVMQGTMGEYDRVKKNRTAGKFEYV